MEYLDFSSVITTIRKYISDAHNMNQIDMMYQLFVSFLSSDESQDFDFDNGLVCRWFNGQAKISPRITGYYMDSHTRNRLAADMHRDVLSIMYDSAMAVQEVYNILVQDTTISDKTKEHLLQNYPCETKMDEAVFLTSALCFGMERTFVKRDTNTKNLLSAGNLSPVVKDFIYDGGTPRPCRHFCGRDNELTTLHQLLCDHGKVFLQGIAGIGKSELAKAYAKQHNKKYTNILYLAYTGDLKQDISDMDFADDLPDDDNEERFRKHNRFLRTLKEDTLFIIDNFNTTATQDGLLPVIMKYRCHILFTTRSKFDNYTSMYLEEIADTEALVKLMGCFYSNAEKNRPILKQIIQTVHSHTLAVEMSARLLESGIMEPMLLLKKLKEEKAALDASDTIGISKDGKNRKATYYDHIHTLFSLYQLSEDETDIMRNLALIPLSGIQNRLFANWLRLHDMNTVNDLIEKGFIKAMEGRTLALHPMMQEVTTEETKPSVQNCHTLLDSLQQICLRHGEEVSYYKQLFQTIESVIKQIENDDMPIYLRFLEDVFPYMENYHYYQGMELVIDTLSTLLKDAAIGSVSDRALLFSYQAAYEKKPDKAIKMQKNAIAMITEVTPDNALMVSNLYANLGGMYRMNGILELAKQNMEQAIRIIDEYGLAHYHDSIVQITNYAVLLTDMGQPDVGLSALRKLCRVIREYNSDMGLDYANVQEAMGNICLTMGEIQKATSHFQKTMEKQGCLYSEVFLPQDAPEEWKDRQVLWEAVESVEKTKDSRLARELVVALPSELSLDDWKGMLERFSREQGTDLGMCADVNIHDPYPPGHNPHSHILFTVRPLDEHGKWQAKTQKEYLCKRGEEERGFTADEFKVAKTQGWEKQYMYQFGEKKEYLTSSEAEKIEGYVRISKTPKSTRYGRQNPLTELWNSEEQIFAWRKSWEMIINEEQERHGIVDRVDCRSHATRGLTEQPTVHEGYHARKLESMGIVSDRCELNRQIRADNKLLRELKKQVQKLMKVVKESIPALASALESLRDHMVLIQYQLIVNTSQQEAVTSQKEILSAILAEYKNVKSEIKAKTAEKKELIAEQKNCGIHFIRASKLGEQIATLTEDIEELKFQKAGLLSQLNCQDNGIAARKQNLKKMETVLETLEQQRAVLSEQKEADKAQFLEMKNGIASENQNAVMQEREVLRPAGRVSLVRKLHEKYRDKYSSNTFDEANQHVDAELQEQPIQKEKRSISEQLNAPTQKIPQPKKQKKKEYER